VVAVVAAELGPVVVEELVAEEGEVLAHQCQPRGHQHQRHVLPRPQRDRTSAVLPASEVVLATGLTLVMRRVPQREHQAAQAIVPLSRREIDLKSDRGLTLAMAQGIGLPLEPARAIRDPEPTGRKSARSPQVAIAPV
jgi:hypothetical protein